MGSERRESAQGWTAWVVGVVGTARAQPHTSVRATTVRRCAWCHHTHSHAHTADRAGQRTQWWWLVGMAHSGGGSHTTHTATTTTCPPPRVCVCVWMGEWTAPAQPVSGPSGHTRHNTHAATTTSTTTSSSSSKRTGGVEWGRRSGWWCEWRARRGDSQHRAHTHTHTPGTKVDQPPAVCVCVAWWCAMPVCVSEWEKGWGHGHQHHRDWHHWHHKRGGWHQWPNTPTTTTGATHTSVACQPTPPHTTPTNPPPHKAQGTKDLVVCGWHGAQLGAFHPQQQQEEEEEEEERTEREGEGTGRKGEAASTAPVSGGGVMATRGLAPSHKPPTTKPIHHHSLTHTQAGKGRGQGKRQDKTKDKEWWVGVVVGKTTTKQVGW